MPLSEILLEIQTDTKIEEENIIKEFLLRLEYSPTQIISSECPDFEIILEGKTIGVEVTKYYGDTSKNGSKEQAKISEWVKFCKILKEKITNIDSKYQYLCGSIEFHDGFSKYKKLLTDDCFHEIKDIITTNNLNPGEQIKEVDLSAKYPKLNQYIKSISLWNSYPENKYLWWDSSLQAGNIKFDRNATKVILEKKEKASEKYKNTYFQKWLIIYAGGMGLHDLYFHQMISDSSEIIEIKEKSQILKSNYFTHVFVWDKFSEVIYLLFPYSKKIFDYGEGKIYVNHLPLVR